MSGYRVVERTVASAVALPLEWQVGLLCGLGAIALLVLVRAEVRRARRYRDLPPAPRRPERRP